MPYKSVPPHLKGLTLAQANKWGQVFDAVKKAGGTSEHAARVAWGVAKGKMRKGVHAAALHAPASSHGDLVLRPSASGARRWQRATANPSRYGDEHYRLLGRIYALGGQMPMTAKEHDNHFHVRQLVRDRMIKLERNPMHHWHEYTAHLTKEGQAHYQAWKAQHEDTGEQESLFKGVRLFVFAYSMRKAIMEKAVIPALDMVPEDIEDEATTETWTEGPYSVTWKRGKKGYGSVTMTGGNLPMPFVLMAAGKKHARTVAAETSEMLQKGKLPRLDGVFRKPRMAT